MSSQLNQVQLRACQQKFKQSKPEKPKCSAFARPAVRLLASHGDGNVLSTGLQGNRAARASEGHCLLCYLQTLNTDRCQLGVMSSSEFLRMLVS